MAQTPEERKAAHRESSRRYRESHRQQSNEVSQKWNEAHKERKLETNRKWRENHREQERVRNREYYRANQAQLKAKLLAKQGSVCAICGGNRGKNALDLDHNHTTGKIRGLLCRPCNLGLGHFADTPEWLRKAADYIESAE
jgi:hypothetical protein